ncbi:hypothetical protein B0H14DRAFT_2629516 [Mycena olivaceomarginata]|nr:hypothetical protein B0H14DRAFT_2629516 [Mycena olivaceomarginata]
MDPWVTWIGFARKSLESALYDKLILTDRLLNAECVEFPSLAEPFAQGARAEEVLLEAEMLAATSHIVAAASQLIAIVRPPVQTIMENSLLFHLSSCMRAAIESNMVEIIREAGTKGIHADDIAKINNTDPVKTSRILRLLAKHHVFSEIEPDVFCANRLSYEKLL